MDSMSNSKKGSQLKQLKQSLKQSGLSRSATSAANFTSRNKKKKSSITANLSHPEFRQQKLKEIQAAQNLFDLKTSKVKFPTANQHQRQSTTHSKKLIGPQKSKLIKTVGNPTQSATQAHQKRVEKLLPEYLNRNKSSQFLDKRFGETDSNLTPEEKALERFTRERQDRSTRANKRNVFNLDDEGEGLYDDGQFGDNATLTHGGLHLKLDDNIQDEQDEPEFIFQKPLDNNSDQSSVDGEQPSRKKSKAEVMSEIITKSKAHKYQRQMMKDKDDELRDELNEELKEIRDLLFTSTSSHQKKSSLSTKQPDVAQEILNSNSKDSPVDNKVIKLSHHSSEINQDNRTEPDVKMKKQEIRLVPVLTHAESSSTQVDRALLETLIGDSSRETSQELNNEQEDAYDRFVRELAFDARAKPTDRMKTGEEAALEEAERLRELELERLKRMRGEEDEENDESNLSAKKMSQRPKRRKAEADDLDDDFFTFDEPNDSIELDSETGLRPDGAFGGGLDSRKDQGESEDDSEDSQNSDSDEQDASSDEDVDNSDDLTVKDDLGKIELLVSTKSDNRNKITKVSKSGKNELAYTYPCPTSHSDFLTILSSASADWSDLPMVVQRMRILYHPSLAEGNKEKLATFTNVLIDHLIYVTSQPLPIATSFTDLTNGILPHLINLCKSYTQTSASHFVSKLVLMHKNLNHALTHPNVNGWPGASELFLLRLIGIIWSTSDFSHPVAAPALLLINQYLDQLRVKHFSDLLSGLFLCTLILQYESLSKRFVPEAINFLVLTIIRMVFAKEKIDQVKCMTPVIEGSELVLFPVNNKSGMEALKPHTLNFTSIFLNNTPSKKEASDQDLVDTLDVTISLLGNFSDIYASLNVYPEVFSSVLAVLQSIDLRRHTTPETNVRITELIESIKMKIQNVNRDRKLNPIKLQSHKPIPIKSLQPQFELDFNPNSKPFNPDSNLVETNKLKNLIKKEKKGAIRELRKDNKFLAITKAKEKEESDLQYKSRMAKITASLQEERSEEKKANRLKSKLKKLDKAKGRR